MEEYLLDTEGNPQLDDDGKKILNPEWVAANKSYTLAPDEVDETGTLGGGGGGGFQPTPEAQAWHDEQVAGLVANKAKAVGQLKKIRTRNEELETENKDLKSELEDLKQQMLDGSGNFDAVEFEAKKKAVESLEQKIETLEAENAGLRKELDEVDMTAEISRAVGSHVKPDFQEYMSDKIRKFAKQNDQGRIYLMDENNQMEVTENGDPMTVEQFVTIRMRQKHGEMFIKDTSKPTGGAQPPGTPPTGKGNIFDKKNGWNATHQAMMLKNDPEKAKSLMRQAGFSEQRIAQRVG